MSVWLKWLFSFTVHSYSIHDVSFAGPSRLLWPSTAINPCHRSSSSDKNVTGFLLFCDHHRIVQTLAKEKKITATTNENTLIIIIHSWTKNSLSKVSKSLWTHCYQSGRSPPPTHPEKKSHQKHFDNDDNIQLHYTSRCWGKVGGRWMEKERGLVIWLAGVLSRVNH